MIRRHFGLDVWVSTLRLDECAIDGYMTDPVFDSPRETTIAYLHLSTFQEARHRWELTDDEAESHLPTESGFGVAVALPAALSEGSKKRFDRALRILGLELHPHSLDDKRIETSAIERDDTAVQDDSWPKLTMLVKSCTSI